MEASDRSRLLTVPVIMTAGSSSLVKYSRSRDLSVSAAETAGAATLVTMTGTATDAEVVEALEVLY